MRLRVLRTENEWYGCEVEANFPMQYSGHHEQYADWRLQHRLNETPTEEPIDWLRRELT